jgi:hypothetical protein
MGWVPVRALARGITLANGFGVESATPSVIDYRIIPPLSSYFVRRSNGVATIFEEVVDYRAVPGRCRVMQCHWAF